MIELRAVEVDNQLQLWDVFVNGKWIGSRRTVHQTDVQVNLGQTIRNYLQIGKPTIRE